MTDLVKQTRLSTDADRNRAALVLFSGGQDSATCLVWALERFERVETVGFDYGQRHRVELDVRAAFREKLIEAFPAWSARLGEDHRLDAAVLKQLGATAMTDAIAIETTDAGLPSTFVPGRNLLFFVLAGALAYRRDLRHLVGGMCETDYSGYPDCRREALDAQMRAIFLGMEYPLKLKTPLMELDKAATWALGEKLGGEEFTQIVIEDSHTCYRGDRDHKHEWGYGCGNCPACDLRSNGYKKWKMGAV